MTSHDETESVVADLTILVAQVRSRLAEIAVRLDDPLLREAWMVTATRFPELLRLLSDPDYLAFQEEEMGLRGLTGPEMASRLTLFNDAGLDEATWFHHAASVVRSISSIQELSIPGAAVADMCEFVATWCRVTEKKTQGSVATMI